MAIDVGGKPGDCEPSEESISKVGMTVTVSAANRSGKMNIRMISCYDKNINGDL